MQSITLPFGSIGLDRLTGEMAARPGSLRDARNVIMRGSKIEVRRGMVVTATLPEQGGASCTHIPLLAPMRFERVGVAVGYYEVTRELHLYRLTGKGENPVHVGLLFTLDDDAQEPPALHAAEVGGKLYIAHDEPLQSRRAATYVYDPLGSEALRVLEAALDSAGTAPMRFRGVIAWHGYLVGWGFASATQNRPEIVRVSLPGEPDRWDSEHYFLAGTRGDPVLSVRPAGGHLLVRKASETYRIHGSSHLDFGILPLHSLSGTLGHRLSIELDGRLYDWSAEGPVLYTGTVEPGRLEVPLDLKGPQPTGFEDLDYTDGFVQYHVGDKIVEWVFGPVSFCLDLDSGQWSYGESPVVRAAGALLYSGVSLADDLDQPPAGHPANLVVRPGATRAELEWENVDAEEGTTAEVWLRPAGGAWYLAAQEPVPDKSSTTLTQLAFPVTYDVAVRYRRGGRYGIGYESQNPFEWPAVSRTTFTTLLETPGIASLEWARLSASTERVRVTVEPADPGVSHQIIRDSNVIGTIPPGQTVYDDTAITGETTHSYRVRAVTGVHESAPSDPMSVWTGPTAQPSNAYHTTMEEGCAPGRIAYDVTWVPGDPTLETQVLVEGVAVRMMPPGSTSVTDVCAPGPEADPQIALRHAVESYGVYDYSPQTNTIQEPL